MNMRGIEGQSNIEPSSKAWVSAKPTQLDNKASTLPADAAVKSLSAKISSSMPSLGKIGQVFSKLANDGHASLSKASEINVGKSFSSAIRGTLDRLGLRQKLNLNYSDSEGLLMSLNTVELLEKNNLSSSSSQETSPQSKTEVKETIQDTAKTAIKDTSSLPPEKLNSEAKASVSEPKAGVGESIQDTAKAAPTKMHNITPQKLEEMAKTSEFIRGEMVSTEKSFADSIGKGLERLDALILLKEGRFKADKVEVLLPKLLPNDPGNLTPKDYKKLCDDHLDNIYNKLENTTVEELKVMKNDFAAAKGLAIKLSEDLDKAKTNQSVADVYVKNSENSSYEKALGKCAENYIKLSSIDSNGAAVYIPSAQRMPRHVMLFDQLIKNTSDDSKTSDGKTMDTVLKSIQNAALNVNNTISESSPPSLPSGEIMTKPRKTSIGVALRGTLNAIGAREKIEFRSPAEILESQINKATRADPPPTLKELKSLSDKLLSLSKECNPHSSSSPTTPSLEHINHLSLCADKIQDLLPKEKSSEKTEIRNDLANMGKELTMARTNYVLKDFIKFAQENLNHMESLFDKFSNVKTEGGVPVLTTSDGRNLPKEAFRATLATSRNMFEENDKNLADPEALKDPNTLIRLQPADVANVVSVMVGCAKSLCKELEGKNPNDPNLALAKEQLALLQKNTAEGAEKNYTEISSAVVQLAELAKLS